MSSPTSAPARSRRVSTTGKVYRHALPNGYRLFWYRIEKVLGQGGFGITYLATDTNLERQVAIKEYLPIDLALREGNSSVHPITDDGVPMYRWGLERFVAEARALARFNHPNIVRVHSVFEANHTAYMVMEYEQGDNLEALFRSRKFTTETDLLRLVFPLLDGLEHMHAAGFIHRDIKPANIYVRADGSVVLLDFGSARMALGTHTQTLTGLVTPGYAPYEQYSALGGRQGPWTDIYALGATLYRALAGKPPADAILRGDTHLEGKRDPLQAATEIGKRRYSTQLLLAIDQALRFLPSERPQTIASWRPSFPRQAPQSKPRRPLARWLRLTIEFGTLGVAGVLIGLLLVVLFLPKHRVPDGQGPTAGIPERAAPRQAPPAQTPPPLDSPRLPSPTAQISSPPLLVSPASPAAQPSRSPHRAPTVDQPTPALAIANRSKVATVKPKTEPAVKEKPEPSAQQPVAVTDNMAKAQEPLGAWSAEGTAQANYARGLQYAVGQGVPRNGEQAVEWFKRAAQQGHSDAQYQLGLLYDQGQGVPQNYMEAAHWYQQAANQGLAAAQHNLAALYDKGKGVPKDHTQAAHWYQQAANQGLAAAQHNLAVLYDKGKGVPRNPSEAAKWYLKAALQHLPAAQTGLALLYEKGQGVPQDATQAARWYRAAAVQGFAAAQYNLGLLLEQGHGVPQNHQEALHWYRKAAQQGLAPAQFSLGLMYDEGKGVTQDYPQAASWYRRSAEQGYDKAQANLGYLYGMGHGVPQDDIQAYAWFDLAATGGDTDAGRNRDIAAGKMTPEELQKARNLSQALHNQYGGGQR